MKKWIVRVLIVVLVLVVIILTTSYVNHQVQLHIENEELNPNGEMVEVNGHDMHVYTEGTGEETLVFMSGGGTSSPILDFKSLYTLLNDSYQTVVVEKAGYGFSDITNEARDIDTILSETRAALSKSGVSAPYILMPHSMSGIEALYWAQLYPDEVKAIIGLDMATPAAYEDYDIPMLLVHLGAFAARNGIIRWIPNTAENDAITYGTLTEDEKSLYETIIYRRTSTKNMVEEVSQIQANAKIVAKDDTPNVPMLLFSSNGEGTGWDEATWTKFQQDFMSSNDNRSLIEMNTSHFLHNIKYEQIAKDVKQFIDTELQETK